MTDNEIIKALECIDGKAVDCKNCFYPSDCHKKAVKAAIELINRKKAEIERLNRILNTDVVVFRGGRGNGKSETIKTIIEARVAEIRAAAIKEFAKRLKTHTRKMQSSDFSGEFWDKAVLVSEIDNLVKEMSGDEA